MKTIPAMLLLLTGFFFGILVSPEPSKNTKEAEAFPRNAGLVPSPASFVTVEKAPVLQRVAVTDDNVMAESLNASATEIVTLQGEIVALKLNIAELKRALIYARNPSETPYGIFLRYPEAAEMGVLGKLAVNKILEEFPLILHPGEGSDLVEIMEEYDAPGMNYYDRIVPYLGAARIRSQLSEKDLKRLSSHIFEDRWARLGLGDYPAE